MDELNGLYFISNEGICIGTIEENFYSFNQNKQLNTQARAAAIWNTLYKNNMSDIVESQNRFKEYYKSIFKK